MRALHAEAARGVGVLAVMHDLSLLAQADRCVLISQGVVRADGPPANVLVPERLREVYETDVEVLRTADGRLAILPALASSGAGSQGALAKPLLANKES